MSSISAAPARSNVALVGVIVGVVIAAAVIAVSLPSPNVPSPPLASNKNVFAFTVDTSSSRSKVATISAGAGPSLPGIGVSEVIRMGSRDAARSSSAPSAIHCRMTSMVAWGKGAPLSGIWAPTDADPSSFCTR